MRTLLVVALYYLTTVLAYAEPDGEKPTGFISQSQIEDLEQGELSDLGAAEQKPLRDLSPIAILIIKDFENWEPSAYDDPSGYCTIGYGHLIAKGRCSSIELKNFSRPLTVAEGEALLLSDTITSRSAIQRLVKVETSDSEFGALTSFVFNVGKGNFENSSLLDLLNDQNRRAAAKEFRRWIKSKGVVLKGLVTRRACESQLFREELELENGHFNRSSCTSYGAADTIGTLLNIETGRE